MYEEHHAHKILTDLLESRGFDVKRGAFDIPTAFKATYLPRDVAVSGVQRRSTLNTMPSRISVMPVDIT